MMMQLKPQTIAIIRAMRAMAVVKARRTTRSRKADRTPAEHSVALATNSHFAALACSATNFPRKNAALATSAGSNTTYVST